MPALRQIVTRWMPLAGVATALCLLVYIGVQQVYRQQANDPQIQLARDAARALDAGAAPESAVPPTPVDLAQSLAPFVTVLNDRGGVIASSGRLRGELRTVPPGVLDGARKTGEQRVTWQPEAGIRMATVTVYHTGAGGGFVVSGRSLHESEARTAQFGQLVWLAWLATLAGLLVLVAGTELLFGDRRPRN